MEIKEIRSFKVKASFRKDGGDTSYNIKSIIAVAEPLLQGHKLITGFMEQVTTELNREKLYYFTTKDIYKLSIEPFKNKGHENQYVLCISKVCVRR